MIRLLLICAIVFSTGPIPFAGAMTASDVQVAAPQEAQAPGASQKKAASTPSVVVPDVEVMDVLITEIDDQSLKTKDGRTFEIGSQTRVDRRDSAHSRLKTARLTFRNGTLVSVSIR